MDRFDLLIVGGGPIGIACGLEAQKSGLSYLIVEKGPIVNSLFNYPVNMQFFSSSERLEIDDVQHSSTIAQKWARGKEKKTPRLVRFVLWFFISYCECAFQTL